MIDRKAEIDEKTKTKKKDVCEIDAPDFFRSGNNSADIVNSKELTWTC